MYQTPNQQPATMVATAPQATSPHPSRGPRTLLAVVVSIVVLLASYALFPGLAAQAIQSAYPTVHAAITNVVNGDNLHVNQGSTFSGAQSTGRDLTYHWTFGDGETVDGRTLTKTFAQPAHQMTATLMVSDPLAAQAPGHSDSQTVTFVVVPAPPTASFSATQTSSFFGDTVTIDATASQSQSQITEYAWDFGDGSTEVDNGPLTSHTYANVGTYQVTLTVNDDFGQSTTLQQSVTVSALSS